MEREYQSEFGKGFTYCIGLFLAHAERTDTDTEKEMSIRLWFNSAADHLFGLEIPESFVLKDECEKWKHSCLTWRLEKYEKQDKYWAIDQAKRFLLEWDKQCGILVEKGEWE
jgi:hypothetical protein